MRKWMDLAAPDDPGAWYAVSNMRPTKYGTYRIAETSIATEINTASTGTAIYAFNGKTLSSTREFVIDAKIWELTAGPALTDRTNSVTVGTIGKPMMATYGNIVICVMGAANATVASTSTTFSTLAGAPNGEIVCVQSNAVLIFNTNTSADGWAASDVGDYTNWSTGEAASGRIIATPGPIVAAVPFGNDVIVFKEDAIYRMTYVGGTVKWQIQLVWNGMGAYSGSANYPPKYQVAATNYGVAFNNQKNGSYPEIYLFDGTSKPRSLAPLTTLTISDPVLLYDSVSEVLTLGAAAGSNYLYYCFPSDAWGQGGGATGEEVDSGSQTANGVLQGNFKASNQYQAKPVYYRYGATNSKMRRCATFGALSTYSCYLQTAKIGRPDRKTTFTRATPLLRTRTNFGSGSEAAALELTLFREREDTSAQTTRNISESSTRKRFDLNGGASSDNFARIKVTWTDITVEVDDFLVASVDAGTD